MAEGDAVNQVRNIAARDRIIDSSLYVMMGAPLSTGLLQADISWRRASARRIPDLPHASANHVFQMIKKSTGSYRV